ncbi:MAG: hypothetical protein HYV09_15845 [Deltaproteobacteria bacterium]|nr:hypothetical protein [Deltaproteobacteria bacterium]
MRTSTGLVFLAVAAVACSKRAEKIAADQPAPSVAPAPIPKTPRVIASGQDHPWGVFVDDRFVWWTNKGQGSGVVARRAKSGGAIEQMATAKAPFAIATFGPHVFWSDARALGGGIGHRLESLPIGVDAECGIKIVEPWSIAVAGGRLFWTDLKERVVASAPLLTSPPPAGPAAPFDCHAHLVHARTAGRPVGLAVDASHVFWTDSDPGVVASAPIAGGAVSELYKGGDKTTGIAVDATHVYWSEWGSGRIAKVPKSGGAAVVLASDQKGARAIALDSSHVYFTHPPTGSIRSVAKSGGAVRVHGTGQKHPYSVAVDASSIYWANVDGDTVMAVDK